MVPDQYLFKRRRVQISRADFVFTLRLTERQAHKQTNKKSLFTFITQTQESPGSVFPPASSRRRTERYEKEVGLKVVGGELKKHRTLGWVR